MQTNILNRTPLYSWHKNAGAKLVPFAGWEMPVVYTSIMQEHKAVREQVGLFDVSHMGQIFVEGKNAFNFIQNLITNDLSKCALNSGIYAHLCNENGGVIDDIFVYSLSSECYLIIVNASTVHKDFEWMLSHKCDQVEIKNASDEFGMVALQGPSSEEVASQLFKSLPVRHSLNEVSYEGAPLFICRTGYTGEDGFEFVVSQSKALHLWEHLVNVGKKFGLQSCGLGARDTLRLEAGYLLYGQDMDETHTTVESGPSWVIQWQKENFIGKAALLARKEDKSLKKLFAFRLLERGIPRHGAKVFCSEEEVGVVTSGTFSPSLNIGIALAYVPQNLEGPIKIECSGKRVPAEKARLPFYKKG